MLHLEFERGLSGRDANEKVPGRNATFSRVLEQAVFPRMQGAPAVNMMAAKAAALGYAMTPEFDAEMQRIRTAADVMASEFQARDYEVVGGCSENHTILIRLHAAMTGAIAETALEHCGIVVNKNRVPGETRSSFVTSGLRIGTGALAQRHVDPQGCRQIVNLLCRILDEVRPLGDSEFTLDPVVRKQFCAETEALCVKYPIADYLAP